jgi:hypothetical protein
MSERYCVSFGPNTLFSALILALLIPFGNISYFETQSLSLFEAVLSYRARYFLDFKASKLPKSQKQTSCEYGQNN